MRGRVDARRGTLFYLSPVDNYRMRVYLEAESKNRIFDPGLLTSLLPPLFTQLLRRNKQLQCYGRPDQAQTRHSSRDCTLCADRARRDQ
jgi:hypothetical protein